jgi:cobalt/nickel transport system permease protein
MSAGHVHAVYRHGRSPIHRADSAVKIAVTLGFVVAVVVTPREAIWAFGVYAAMLVAGIAITRVGPGFVIRRMVVLLPFLIAASTLPFLGGPPDTSFGLSIEGLWGAWNIVAKGTLGLTASIVLAATTEGSDIVAGLERLRMPRVVTAIMGFMLRYVDVVIGEFSRTRVAMRSRGYRPRWLGSVGALGRSIGHLFVRSYERGERVFLAMASRGYDGSLAVAEADAVPATQITGAMLIVALAWAAAIAAVVAG